MGSVGFEKYQYKKFIVQIAMHHDFLYQTTLEVNLKGVSFQLPIDDQ